MTTAETLKLYDAAQETFAACLKLHPWFLSLAVLDLASLSARSLRGDQEGVERTLRDMIITPLRILTEACFVVFNKNSLDFSMYKLRHEKIQLENDDLERQRQYVVLLNELSMDLESKTKEKFPKISLKGDYHI
ncbi:MAG: hypothetical protein Q8K86_09510 [Candidatus Nanopelagicaceae bacterium]|nr:hypothetical protein [Candidatus Nanopelagicaceae bacterium]